MIVLLSGCAVSAPQAPEIISASFHDNAVHIAWNEVENADCYRIFCSTENGDDEKFICDTDKTEYIDRDNKEDASYVYTVYAINSGGISNGRKSDAVTVISLSAEGDAASKEPIHITSVTEMDDYTTVILLDKSGEPCEVLRSSTANGDYQFLGITEDGAYYDTKAGNGKNYFYKARRAGETGNLLQDGVPTGTNPGFVFSVPVFMYHEFVTEEDLAGGVAFDEYAIYSYEFEQDLKWLSENGYTTITASQLVSYLEGSGSLPDKPVILTIDDGKYGVYKRAWPLLKQYNMKAVLAVIGSRIDQAVAAIDKRELSEAPYCTWDEIGEMSDSGVIEIISHTYNLHIFNHDGREGACTAENETSAQYLPMAQKDFVKITRKIYEVTNSRTIAMAYPYSKRTAESDKAWLQAGCKLLFAGDSDSVHRSRVNYFVYEAGLNCNASLLRRITRMTGKNVYTYLDSTY